MKLVPSYVALILFAIILLAAAVISWKLGGYEHYHTGSFHTFISILVGLGVLVTFMFYYNIVQLQNEQQQLASIQEAARISDSVLNNLLDELKLAAIIIPHFVASVTPLTSGCEILGPDLATPEARAEKLVLSYRIFSLWQDYVRSTSFADLSTRAVVTNFLQRANSEQLYEQWLLNKINFCDRTQLFGDLLFEYSLKITVQTPEEYQEVSQKLVSDPKFKQIFG